MGKSLASLGDHGGYLFCWVHDVVMTQTRAPLKVRPVK